MFLWRVCWHIGVANTAALKLANILPPDDLIGQDTVPSNIPTEPHHAWFNTTDGVIDVDAEGVPSGVLREKAAEIVRQIYAQTKSVEDRALHFENGLKLCVRNGLTGVQTNDDEALDIYKSLEDNIKLCTRVFLTPIITDLVNAASNTSASKSSSNSSDYLTPYVSRYTNPDNKMTCKHPYLYAERVKLFSDGSLSAETAAIRSNVEEGNEGKMKDENQGEDISKGYTGVLMYKTEELISMITLAKKHAYRIEVHAIGDAAAEQVLKAMDACGIIPEDRAILTHAQVY